MSAIGHVHEQDRHSHEAPRFYAWCACGVCCPIRYRRADALADARAHGAVCTGGAS